MADLKDVFTEAQLKYGEQELARWTQEEKKDQGVVEKVKRAVANVVDYITNVYETIVYNIVNVYETVVNYVTNVYETITNFISNTYETIVNNVTNVYETVNNYVTKVFNTYVTNITEVIGVTQEKLTEWWKGKAEWFSSLMESTAQELQKYVNSRFALIAPAINVILLFFEDIQTFFADPEEWLYKSVDRIIERFW